MSFKIIGTNKLKTVPQKIQVSSLFYYNIFFYFIVIGLAANKSDLYDKEEVSEETARQFAEKIGAIFKLTSACTSVGVEELFVSVGSKYLDPNFKDDGSNKPKAVSMDGPVNPPQEGGSQKPQEKAGQNKDDIPRHQSIRLDPNKVKETKKKKCC